mgnify:CR=1 FL=1
MAAASTSAGRSDHRYEHVRCLILTSYDDDDALFAAVMAGASGYLLKQIGGNNLVEGIRQVAAGRSLLDPAVTQKLLDRLRHPVEPDPVAGSLTAREREILDLIAEGCTNRQIGERLFLGREDRQELRFWPAHQARHAATDTGGGVRGDFAAAH